MTRYDLSMDTTIIQSDYREVKFKKKKDKKEKKSNENGGKRKQKKLLDELFPEPDQSNVTARYPP